MAFTLPRIDHVITLPFSSVATNKDRSRLQRHTIKVLRESYSTPLQRELRQQAPSRNRQDRTTGRLRRNIRVSVTSQRGYKIRIRFNVNTARVLYAGFLEREWDEVRGTVYDLFVRTFADNTYRIKYSLQRALFNDSTDNTKLLSQTYKKSIADADNEAEAEAARLERAAAFEQNKRDFARRLAKVKREGARRLSIINRRLSSNK